MPNEELTVHDSTQLNKIGFYVCQAIIAIQEQQPELLLEKYRNVQWLSSSNQLNLTAKFIEILSPISDRDALLQKLHKYLKAMLTPEAFTSPILLELVEKLRQINTATTELNGSDKLINFKLSQQYESAANSLTITQTGIAVLLLDAENLQLNTETEKFLKEVCNYPIQVKIAFANWCSMGKRDVELHGRGYDLIHVPTGKDNADGKMIAFGSSVRERYPNAKEVLVCSSDKVMTNLCNHLQQNGLIVYQVSKQGEGIIVLNYSQGKIVKQFLNSGLEIPTLEQFLQQIKELIKVEQKHTQSCWVKLATISQTFKNKYKFNISQVISKHLPGKKARDIFINYPADFVIHQVDEASECYITLFEIEQAKASNNQDDSLIRSADASLLSRITSKADLEQALKYIINELTKQSPDSYINIGNLGSSFKQQYGKPITEQIKSLQLSGNFIKFLQSCSSFNLKQTEQGWKVGLGTSR
ncbi:NYN domain-containing protein [Nostocaceae cyanobacterium CENA369]|uniref:NYN domain-containing protein n=1 Tax=Dendronalium phyllosphericum CENA369 TaxID=1725256 RepID=A0A8J7IP96_9NOST|nr:NYN domain-containing protein [Dendronalium phyllosphericum]MBH8578202.1 NYN domain-containing protein [Dendronalium phyllosphericum CENA369]